MTAARGDPARDPSRSVWVAASAGSGKTYVLVDRLLVLLLAETAPSRLMCVTFTKAAAAEMANRLHKVLAGWARADDAALIESLEPLIGADPGAGTLARARRLFAQVLETPGGLKIQTVHSFCESLLGRFPLEAGIAPHFDVMDERTAAEAQGAARDAVLEAAADREGSVAQALRTVYDVSGETGFDEIFAFLVAGRGKLKGLEGEGGLDAARARLARSLGAKENETADTVLARVCAEGAFDGAGLKAAVEALRRGSKTDAAAAERIAAWLGDPAHRTAGFDSYALVFLTKDGAIRKKLITKKTVADHPRAAEAMETEAARVLDARQQLLRAALFERSSAVLALGAALLGAYEHEKQRHNLLDYEDLIQRARTLLSQPGVAPWVLYKLDGGIDHILVDEAQDTSPDQWAIVAAIAEEFFAGKGSSETARTLFVVGDQKQSIYSFQGADPAEFESMRQHFRARADQAAQGWAEVPLTRSYRSVAAVLHAVDAVFIQESARSGVTADDRWEGHRAHREGQGGEVELWPTVQPKQPVPVIRWLAPREQQSDAPAETVLASRIAATISDWVTSAAPLESRGRAIRPGDVMILVRRRTVFFEDMVGALKRRGLPVAGIDRMVITEQLAVMDLMALGRFALLPDDDLTLATVLKGPLFGFDDARLFDLAWKRDASLWDTLRARRTEAVDFVHAHDVLNDLLARADFESPFDWYARILGAGGRRDILGRLGAEADDPLDEFLSMALLYEHEHAPSLEGFLFWLEAGKADIKRDLEQERNEVRVMTVHGAKGLQAPIVFLPDTTGLPPDRHALLWAGSSEDAVPLWLGRAEFDVPASAAARDAARARERAEYRRLLYVAMTRAEDRLYVCGWENKKGVKDGSWYDLVRTGLPEIAEPAKFSFDRRDAGLRLVSPQTAKPVDPSPLPESGGAVPALPDWAGRAAPEEAAAVRALEPSRLDEDELPAASPLTPDDGARYRRGNAIHRLLEVLPRLPVESREGAALAWLARESLGFDPEQQKEIAAETLGVLSDPRFSDAFSPAGLSEVPIAGRVGEIVLSGQIDRLVVRADNVLVIDYKTNRHPPERIADIPLAYFRQMAAYRAALSAIYPERNVQCALLWTVEPRLVALDSDVLDGALS